MKKVTAFIASPQKRATYGAVREFEEHLRACIELDFEYVFLKDYHLENCTGCCLCFEMGEESCPLSDDRDRLIQKLSDSDGVIFATPNYAFQVSAPMKTLLDRLAFVFHRPRFFGKAFTAVVTYGIFGGDAIVKYLGDTVGKIMGFNVAKGCALKTLAPVTEAAHKKNMHELEKAARRFYRELTRPALPTPSLFGLMLFRFSRTSIKEMLGEAYRDYRYYEEHGWFEDDYYYPVSLGPVKKTAGRIFDLIGGRTAKN